MRLGDVLRKERQRKQLTVEELAERLELRAAEYVAIEQGDPIFEEWAPRLGRCAVMLKCPTSRLISVTGRSRDSRPEDGQMGRLIGTRREQVAISPYSLAVAMGIDVAELVILEQGNSPLERYGTILLRISEIVEQPVFNLLNPCGIPAADLVDYP
jgi:hypothetical protein